MWKKDFFDETNFKKKIELQNKTAVETWYKISLPKANIIITLELVELEPFGNC